MWEIGTERVIMAPYGPAVYIPKEDCIVHVTKRMRTTLRKLTMAHKGEQIFDSLWTDSGNSKWDNTMKHGHLKIP